MKIKTKLHINLAVSFLTALLILATVLLTNAQMETLENEADVTSQFAQRVAELETVIYQFILYGEAWAKEEWVVKEQPVGELLAKLEVHNEEEQKLVENIQRSMKGARSTFAQLSAVETPDSSGAQVAWESLDERISGLLLVFAQTMVADTFSLSGFHMESMASARITADYIVLTLGAVLVIVVGAMSLFIFKSILNPLSALQAEVGQFGGGKWSSRITIKSKDEVGELGAAFNTMAEEIEGNLESLTKAKSDLVEHKKHLEQKVVERTRHLEQQITERKFAETSLRESEERLLQILDSSPFGVSIASRESKERLYVNRRFIEMFGGQSDDEMISWHASDSYVDENDRAANWAAYERNGSIAGREELRKRLDGTVWWCLSDWRPFSFGGKESVMVWHSDITELRTPLNAIIGFSEMIKEAMFGPLGSRYQDYAKDINSSGTHLLGIISDILDISKVEVGELVLDEDEVNLAETAAACETMVKGKAEEAGVSLAFNVPVDLPMLRADPLRLKQVLLNLIGNAIKFTPEGGRITVSGEVNGSGGVVLAVNDTGVGIAESEIPKILEKFGQVRDGHTYAHEGAGLGLALVKSMMELHGGTLKIESEIGKGTLVTAGFPPERSQIAATET